MAFKPGGAVVSDEVMLFPLDPPNHPLSSPDGLVAKAAKQQIISHCSERHKQT